MQVELTYMSLAESVTLLVQGVGLNDHLLQLMGGITVDAVLLRGGVGVHTQYMRIVCLQQE